MEKGGGIYRWRITLENKKRRENRIARPDYKGDIGDDVD